MTFTPFCTQHVGIPTISCGHCSTEVTTAKLYSAKWKWLSCDHIFPILVGSWTAHRQRNTVTSQQQGSKIWGTKQKSCPADGKSFGNARFPRCMCYSVVSLFYSCQIWGMFTLNHTLCFASLFNSLTSKWANFYLHYGILILLALSKPWYRRRKDATSWTNFWSLL